MPKPDARRLQRGEHGGDYRPVECSGASRTWPPRTWATPEVVGHLVAALDAVLDLQSLGFSDHADPIWDLSESDT